MRDNGTIKIWVNFGITLEMTLISSKIDLVLTCSANCVLSDAPNQAIIFAIANTIFFSQF